MIVLVIKNIRQTVGNRQTRRSGFLIVVIIGNNVLVPPTKSLQLTLTIAASQINLSPECITIHE